MRVLWPSRPISMLAVAALLVAMFGSIAAQRAAAAVPSVNAIAAWDQIAENTIVGSGAFQNESWVYMAYTTAAMYDATVAIKGQYRPYTGHIHAGRGASTNAAIATAAYLTLHYYFPAQATTLDALYAEALAAIPNGRRKTNGIGVGTEAANQIIALRTGDGRQTPIGSTASFPTKTPGAGLWRLTPPAYAAAQTPWVANVKTFVVPSAARYLPKPPPSLGSDTWVHDFNEIKAVGSATSTERTAAQSAVALFWTANTVRAYNRLAREIAAAKHLGIVRTARLMAMLNVVLADTQISVMYAKYHYLFWRPVSAIDPSSVSADGYGPVPGFDDGNAATVEQAGWRPLVVTPNHPEYPAAHGTVTSGLAEVLTRFLGTSRINITVHGFDAAGAPGNFDAARHFTWASDLRREIINARLWGGLHYHFSGVAGVTEGRSVARYDLSHAFQPIDD
jgi:hypothetical protein